MQPITVVLVVAVFGLVLWFAGTCLADLARTPEDQVRVLPRAAWAVLIVATIPLGGILYFLYGRGPRRYV